MARNKISDMNDHLFAQLERLGDENMSDEALNKEISRSKAMAQIATQIVNGAKTSVEAMKLARRGDIDEKDKLKLLGEG
jgi:hypothetical protein